MKVDVVSGVEFDMRGWPLVKLTVSDSSGLVSDRQAVIDGIVNILGKTIISAASKGLQFKFQVDFMISVSNLFRDLAPFILEFALAMARPDIFEASKHSLEQSKIRFHSEDDVDMAYAVAQLIAHVPQGAPVEFEMARN